MNRSADNFNNRAYVLVQLGRLTEADRDIAEALSKDGTKGVYWANQGLVRLRQGRLQEALTSYEKAISLDQKNAEAFSGRAESKEKLGDFAGAKADYQTALRLEPELEWAKKGLAHVAAAGDPAAPTEGAPGATPAQANSVESAAAAESSRSVQLPEPPELSPQLTRRLQGALAELGFNVGKPDGDLGRRTISAVAAYKRSAKLPTDTPLDEAFVAGAETAAEERSQAITATNAEAAKQAATKQAEAQRQRQAAEAAVKQARAEAAAETERRAEAQRQQAAQAALASAKAPTPKFEAEIAVPKAPPQPAPQIAAATATMPAATPPAQTSMVSPVPEPAQAAMNALPAAAPDPSRIALVIGNSGYLHAPTLPNPRNDASDVAALLRQMGFTVMDATDLDRNAMEDLMIRFAKAAARAEIAVTYYAGHGLQVDGTNYLVPVDADIEDELDLRRLIRLDDMVRDTGRAGQFGVVMIDACRDNPFEVALSRSLAGTSRSSGPSRGLAAPVVPPRVLVAFATAATQTAADGLGRNSPFATGVLQHLAEPDDIRFVVGRIVDSVAKATQQRQRPDTWASLGGERNFLVKPEAVAEALDAQLTPPERTAVLSALARLGMYSGPLNGTFSPSARRAIRDFQVRSGASPTGSLTVEQMIALYDQGRLGGAVEPLPPVDIVDLLRRSESGAPDAELLRAKVFDRSYEAGPLPKDMSEAARWYRKAADAGDAEAALALGLLLQDGDGVDLDLGEARRWLAAAAKTGNTEAQYRLALLYLDPTDPGADRSEAIRLLKQAAQSNSGEAIGHLRQLKAWDPP